MPSVKEMSEAELRAHIKELEEDAITDRRTIERLQGRLASDADKIENAKLNRELGSIETELETARAALTKMETAHQVQTAQLTEKSSALCTLKKDHDSLLPILHRTQLALAGKTWGPWAACVLISLLIAFFVWRGIIIPRSGDTKGDTNAALNQLMTLNQLERDRALELEKPKQVWGVRKFFSSDEKAIVQVQVNVDSREDKRILSEFVSSLIVTALRGSIVVGRQESTPPRQYLAFAGSNNLQEIQNPDLIKFLNENLTESGLALIATKLPEFNVSFNVEFLKVGSDGQRTTGFGFWFDSGKFTERQQQQHMSMPAPIGKG